MPNENTPTEGQNSDKQTAESALRDAVCSASSDTPWTDLNEEDGWNPCGWAVDSNKVRELELKCVALQKTLEFYADEDTWELHGAIALSDYGDKARESLANVKGVAPLLARADVETEVEP